MKTGEIDALIDGTMKVIYDSGELIAAATTITISGLNGDVDGEYELIVRAVSGATDAAYYIRPNNDTGSNYGGQYLKGSNTTASAIRETAIDHTTLGTATTVGDINFSVTKIQAKSGYLRTFITKAARNIATTTIGELHLTGQVHNDTVNNYTSLVVYSDRAGGLGVGTRIVLLKKVTATDGMKCGNLEVQGKVKGMWQEVYNSTLTTAATTITVSGLSGNTDVLYRLRCRVVNGYNGGTIYYLRPNNVSTAANYGRQEIKGNNVTASASRDTNTGIILSIAYNLNEICMNETILQAKSGYVRTAITESNGGISGTTVGEICLYGQSWNNTADEITSLVVLADQTDGFGVGTELVVERLNL